MESIGFVKRGDTLSFTAEMVDDSTDEPLTGIAEYLKCQGKYELNSDVILEMTISETSEPGTYLFEAPSTSDLIPGNQILFDIQYSKDTITASSVTFYITVVGDVTSG